MKWSAVIYALVCVDLSNPDGWISNLMIGAIGISLSDRTFHALVFALLFLILFKLQDPKKE